jgi:TRAP-type transport system periplasmic protein
MLRWRWIAAVVLAPAVVACGSTRLDKAGGSHPAKPVHLQLANNNSIAPTSVLDFVRAVDQQSDSGITIDYEDNWRKGEPDQELSTVADVAAGRVDMAWVGARVLDEVGAPFFQPLLAPFLVDSYDVQQRVFAAGIPARMLDEVHLPGITAIGVLPGALRKLTGVARPFVKVDDFSGARIGTSAGELADETFRALGATPVRVPAQASLAGLDAIDNQPSSVQGNQYYKTARFLTTNVDLWPRPVVLLISSTRYAALPEEQRQLLRRAAQDVLPQASNDTMAEERQAGSGLCLTPMKLVAASDAQRATLVHAVDQVYAQLDTNPTLRGYLDQIRTVKSSVAAAPDTILCPPSSEPAVAPTPIDGVWEMTVTKEELAKVFDPADVVPENYGHFLYVFDQGHFALSQESELACTWEYGNYIVDGEQVNVTMIDGGGLAPSGALAKPGERWVYRWSEYRDQLTLNALSPITLTVPLSKVDEKPSMSIFPDRCAVPAEALPGR